MSYFETRVRDSGVSFVTLTDDAPAWLRDAVQAAHDDEVPNDWRYAMCERIWAHLEGFEVGEVGDDELSVIADELTDVYTNTLTAWLSANLDRVALVDSYIEECGADGGMAGVLMGAQCRAIGEMARILRDARDENAELSDSEVAS